MLPFLASVQATSKIAYFSQDADFPLNLSDYTKDGACAAISFDWIRHHKEGTLDKFVKEINMPERIHYIQDFQMKYNYSDGLYGINQYMKQAGLQVEATTDVTLSLNSASIAEAMTVFQGYVFTGYNDRELGSGHAVAMFNSNEGYEFFDPNYGSALFPTHNDFVKWFEFFAWYQTFDWSDMGLEVFSKDDRRSHRLTVSKLKTTS